MNDGGRFMICEDIFGVADDRRFWYLETNARGYNSPKTNRRKRLFFKAMIQDLRNYPQNVAHIITRIMPRLT